MAIRHGEPLIVVEQPRNPIHERHELGRMSREIENERYWCQN
jgi:hypothetical protein